MTKGPVSQKARDKVITQGRKLKEWFTREGEGREMSRDSSLVPDPSPQTASSQPFQTLPTRGLCRRPEGRRGEGGCCCYSRKGLEWGEEQLLPPPPSLLPHLQIHT